VAGIRSSYELLDATADFVFAPYVRPFDDNVISPSAFKPRSATSVGRP
jgi:hypothetical protein